jgi:hypothetical protein
MMEREGGPGMLPLQFAAVNNVQFTFPETDIAGRICRGMALRPVAVTSKDQTIMPKSTVPPADADVIPSQSDAD